LLRGGEQLRSEGEARPAARHAARVDGDRRQAAVALRTRGVWHELRGGRAILRGVTLKLRRGETVALMGRNGSGKSTLLRHAAGLLEPTRGAVERKGRVALLLQNPGDYFLHERVGDEAPAEALAAVGLEGLAASNPRDISGGERQRLALAIVSSGSPPAVVALDEPTRGMDRAVKSDLAAALRLRACEGQAVLVATHDPEFAAAVADRALLMADGRIIADGPVADLLTGGWYFATETARILGDAARASDGAGGQAPLLPEQGAKLLRASHEARAPAGGQAPGPRSTGGDRVGLAGTGPTAVSLA
jgi:energy-coupling factor transport system ATP-binding protein